MKESLERDLAAASEDKLSVTRLESELATVREILDRERGTAEQREKELMETSGALKVTLGELQGQLAERDEEHARKIREVEAREADVRGEVERLRAVFEGGSDLAGELQEKVEVRCSCSDYGGWEKGRES